MKLKNRESVIAILICAYWNPIHYLNSPNIVIILLKSGHISKFSKPLLQNPILKFNIHVSLCLQNNPWKYCFIFLYRIPMPFTWYVNYYSTVSNGGVGIFISYNLAYKWQTDEWTYTVLKSPRHTDSNGIWYSVVAWINTKRKQNNTSPQYTEKTY